MTEFLDGRLRVLTGDITAMNVDAIVNAANSSLLGGGGVDGAIHRKAGPALLEECRKIRQSAYPSGLPSGMAVMTGAGSLPARFVIHTVGPVWHGGGGGERELLASCYRSSLETAWNAGLKTMAFPAISTGVYGFPKPDAARIAFRTVTEFLTQQKLPEIVHLVFFSQDDCELFLSSIPSDGSR